VLSTKSTRLAFVTVEPLGRAARLKLVKVVEFESTTSIGYAP
jgi:hypothetical protein